MISMQEKNNRQSWDQRSLKHKNELKGVLFKRFPDSLNQHIHQAHVSFVLDNISEDTIKILDVGCGYGRISLEILKQYPKADIKGMDVSEIYVELYKKNTGQNAFQGNLGSLPEDIGHFDLIVCVTALMYVSLLELEQTIGEMLKHLTENGKIILIEPLNSGKFFSSGFGLLKLFSKSESNTAGNSFAAGKLKKKVKDCGGAIILERRTPVTTLFIVPIYLFSKVFKHMGLFYKVFRSSDKMFGRWMFPSIHTFMVIERKH